MANAKPVLSGLLLTDAKDPKERKQIGKVALWENSSENENAPVLQGVVQTEKAKYRLALWKFKQRDGSL